MITNDPYSQCWQMRWQDQMLIDEEKRKNKGMCVRHGQGWDHPQRTYVNLSCQKIGESNTPIIFMFVDMRFENEPMHTILDTKETSVILFVVLVCNF